MSQQFIYLQWSDPVDEQASACSRAHDLQCDVMSFIDDLRRRQVLRTAAAYVAVAWLLIQVVETTFPAFGFGEEAVRLVIIVAVLGFIPAVVTSWVFRLTPDGLQKDSGTSMADAAASRNIDRAIIVLLALGIIFFAVDKFIFDPQRDSELAAQARSDALVESYGDKSIAVMAFADMSPNSDSEYFSDGIAEEMINLLAKIPELRVISRSSAFAFKDRNESITDIAEELNVSHVLEGSVRRDGDRIRVTAQLIDARSDAHLYSDKFDRTADDIFATQDEIAARVVEELKVHLTGAMPHARPTDPEAYALLLRARYLKRQMTTTTFDQAEQLLLQSLELDPGYLGAIHELIRTYIGYAEGGSRPLDDMRAKIRTLVARAMEIDPDDGYTIIISGYPDGLSVRNIPITVDALQRGLARDSSNLESIRAAAELLRLVGSVERSTDLLEYALERDPLCMTCVYRLAQNYIVLQDYDKAEAYILKFRQANYGGTDTLATVLFLKGEYQQAADLFATLQAPMNPRATMLHGQALTGIGLKQPELVDKATDALLADYYDSEPLYLAEIFSLTGDVDAAFAALDRAFEQSPRDQIVTYQRALLGNLHDDPRWDAFREKTGTSEEALARIQFDVEIAGER